MFETKCVLYQMTNDLYIIILNKKTINSFNFFLSSFILL